MTSVMGLNTSNHNIKRGIPHTRIFWQLTRQSLPMRLTPWRQTAGSAQWSPRSGYCTVQSMKRLCMQHNNFEAQLEPGGLLTSPPYLLITMFHGMSSVLLSSHITYLWVCSAPSYRNSWTLSKGTAVYLTTRGSSTPLPNMGHTTSTWMRRKLTSTVKGLPSTCKSAWVFPPTFPKMNW
jgi:hypothetical protein